MDNKQKRKSLTAAYKEKAAIGGVLAIVCSATGKRLLLSSSDLRGQQNRFAFALSTDSCVVPLLQTDWDTHGKDTFTLEVLEQLTQLPSQDDTSFRCDLKTLEVLWREKYRKDELY